MKEKKEYEVGEEISLMMLKPTEGSRPISRTNEGKICLINHSKKGYFPYNSTWLCKIIKIYPNKLIVEPLELLVTKESNDFALREKFKKLKELNNNNKKVRTKVKNYSLIKIKILCLINY